MSTIAPKIRAYELWYEYLMETKPETWNDEVRKDFGGALTAGSFEEWYSSASLSLFRIDRRKPENTPIMASGLREMTRADLEALRDRRRCEQLDEEADDRGELTLIAINRSCPPALLMKLLENYLMPKQPKRKPGRPAWKAPTSKYTFSSPPHIEALEISLAAYRLKKNGIPNWQVGSELAKKFPILRNNRIKGDDDDLEIKAKRKGLASTASRYLKKADAVLAGVINGVFPAK